jgi:hypothetical protein
MRIIAFIEDEELIKKILKHLGLWEAKARPPPKVKAPFPTIYLDDSESQILPPDSFYAHPDYPADKCMISEPHRVTSLVTISAINLQFFNHRKCLDLILIYI